MTEARPLEAVEPPKLEPVLSVPASERQRGLRLAAKRAIDVIGATAVLVIMSPVALAVALAVRLNSRGPAIYQCTQNQGILVERYPGEITPEELQDMMAGGQELAELEGSLGGTV